jgi:hypothetical protein
MNCAARLATDPTCAKTLLNNHRITKEEFTVLDEEDSERNNGNIKALLRETRELRVTILVTAFAAMMQYEFEYPFHGNLC